MSNTFTDKAQALWNSIPKEDQYVLLTNVWCTNCRKAVTITNYNGRLEGNSLVLTGKCSVCSGIVARVIEGD